MPSIEKVLGEAYVRGARKALVVGVTACSEFVFDILNKHGFSWVEKPIEDFPVAEIASYDLVVVFSGAGDDVSRVLHACIDLSISVVAPVTDHHVSRRTVFLMSIPKAGTHMMIRLFDLMGLPRSSDREQLPGTWSTPVGYEYHAPCRELLDGDCFEPIGRQLLFRSPAIFVYRNPLDIVVSELDWFVKAGHAFSGYLNSCKDESEQLSRLIVDQTVLGSIRDRINRYAGWVNFNNVIPVSYEELVGARGGGRDTQQADSIWALQLKLHIAGSPEAFGSQLYDPGSATFSKGIVGRHMERFESKHVELFDSLPQDFMHSLGYTRNSPNSLRTSEFLYRPLVVKDLPTELLYTPRLVGKDLLGWNIVEMAGQYFPVQHGEHILSSAEALAFSHQHKGFMTISDAVGSAIYRMSCIEAIKQQQELTAAHGAEADRRLGELLSRIDAVKQQQELTDAHDAEADCRLSELLSRIDAIKQQQELTDAHGAEADCRLSELLSRIDAIKQQQELTDAHGAEAGCR
ncbi:MAG: hypothetical protein WC856_27460, partial [Methylococcaceae bacterium]